MAMRGQRARVYDHTQNRLFWLPPRRFGYIFTESDTFYAYGMPLYMSFHYLHKRYGYNLFLWISGHMILKHVPLREKGRRHKFSGMQTTNEWKEEQQK